MAGSNHGLCFCRYFSCGSCTRTGLDRGSNHPRRISRLPMLKAVSPLVGRRGSSQISMNMHAPAPGFDGEVLCAMKSPNLYLSSLLHIFSELCQSAWASD